MTRYQITSHAGAVYGIYEGRTPAEALCLLHRDAGYPTVMYDGYRDCIVWPDDDTRELCGDVTDWDIVLAQ